MAQELLTDRSHSVPTVNECPVKVKIHVLNGETW